MSWGHRDLRALAIDQEISERLARLKEMKNAVDASGAEPALSGTTTPVHAVAALVRRQGEAQTLTDRPSLLRRLTAPFRALGWFLIELAEAGPKMQALRRLSEMSDAQLAARGTTRDAEIRRILGASALV